MKKLTLLILIMLFGLSFIFKKKDNGPKPSIHGFKVKTIEGQEFDMASLKGKKVLIVNTASECGLTPQYKQLEEVFEKYKDKNFTILGFPANNFGSQEPGSNTEIKAFCTKNYGVTFQMMEKVSVKGDDMCELYKWLTQKEKNGVASSSVKWNFQKYMIDEEGHLVDSVSPTKKPNCDKIINWIEGKK
ncbi:MAG: glutathione peroxidase [Bacteroidia bacterium]|nr:glutathione peroxidase [Bacteroidia bacterium]